MSAYTRLARGTALVGGLNIGGHGDIFGFSIGELQLDPPSIDPGARAAVSVQVPGVTIGDVIVLNPPGNLAEGLSFSGARVQSENTVHVFLTNHGSEAVDDTARLWRYIWFKAASR